MMKDQTAESKPCILPETEGGTLPLVSVIVPVYDVEAYLNKCLDSVLAQTYRHFELLLIDDGSPDGCGIICDQYAARDERVRALHQSNQGLSAARNTGLDAARGEYIFFIDSDDSVDPSFLSSAMEAALRQKADVVCFGYRIVNNQGQIKRTRGFSREEIISNEQAALLLLSGKISIDVWVKSIKRSLFDEIRFPVGRLSECGVLTPQVFDRAQRILLLPTVTYNYLYPREGSICTESTEKYREDARLMWKAKFNYIAKAHPALLPAVKEAEHASYVKQASREFCFFSENNSQKQRKLAGFIRRNTKEALKNRRMPPRYKIWLLFFFISPKLAAGLFRLYANPQSCKRSKEAV